MQIDFTGAKCSRCGAAATRIHPFIGLCCERHMAAVLRLVRRVLVKPIFP